MKYDFEELMKENMNIQETPSEELKERIMHYDKEERIMNHNRKYFKNVPKAAAVALAAILVTGGIAYAGTNLWNQYVAEDFGVAENDTLMKDLNQKGFAQQPQAEEAQDDPLSVTDQDITVTVQQTLADEHSAYVCFEVKYGEQYQAVKEGTTELSDYGIAVPEWTHFQMASGMELNYSGGISKIVDDHTILYNYFLTTSNTKDSFEDGRMKMSISSFTMDRKKCDDKPDVIAKDGKWDLSWDLSVGTEKRVYHLDRTLTLGKDQIVLKDLEISPLSCKLTMQCPEGGSLVEICAVVKDRGDVPDELDDNGDLKVIRYVRTDDEKGPDEIMEKLPKGQTLYFLDSIGICLGQKDFDGTGGLGQGGADYLYAQFDKILDLEEVTGARVAGKYVDLTDVPYETAK